MNDTILVIDAGTTSTRAMLIDTDGRCRASAARPIEQHHPAPGLIEQDAREIWEKTLTCALEMAAAAGGASHIATIGITNQRETVVFWDAVSGEPVSRAIVWQDRRSAATCNAMRDKGYEPLIQRRTGLLLDPYFSASKIGWALNNWEELRGCGNRLRCGTVESWLLFKLTGGLHATDASNASRTSLMQIENGGGWDSELCELFGVPPQILPPIVDCAGKIGATRHELFGAAIPITAMAGDQQAATIGQGCLVPGQVKATYGTGAFVLANAGRVVPLSGHRLLATVLWQLGGERRYALEGSVFVAGSLIQWLRDKIGMLASAEETEALARSVPDTGGVYMVPALAGLGAPHWRSDATAQLSGLSFASGRAQIARAALESVSYQTHDLKRAFAADGVAWRDLRIDGGMVANDWLAQDLADILEVPVERPAFIETTALGVAMLAAVGAGIHTSLDEAASAMRGPIDRFRPQLQESVRSDRVAGWDQALARVLG